MIRKIIKLISWLRYNPGLFMKHLVIQAKKLTPVPKNAVVKKVNGVSFRFEFNFYSAVKSMYIGGYGMDTVEVMKKYLKKGGVFMDVGANIGYLTAVGAGLVGKEGEVHSFEPVPQYFLKLENLRDLNPDYRIMVNKCALGETPATADLRLSTDNNIGWNTMVPAIVNKKGAREILKVPVCRLDDYIKEKGLNKVTLIKIDVEGFEFPVLKGLGNYFSQTPQRPVVICEINPFVCLSMGYSLADIMKYMKKYGYNSYNLLNCDIETDITIFKETTDVVFISKN